MGIPVLILGESGSGKSTSLRNFKQGEIGILNVADKPLPFRNKNKIDVVPNISYKQIESVLKRHLLNAYAIDDSQYLMAFSMFDKAKEVGYNKFTEIAVDFYDLLKQIRNDTPRDCIVYLLHHIEVTDSGRVKAKTMGKMLDNQLTLEGLFSIILLCRTDGQRHWFETQSDGFTTVKSPIDMFVDREIDNDLKMVDSIIREYWELKPIEDNLNKQNSEQSTSNTGETVND